MELTNFWYRYSSPGKLITSRNLVLLQKQHFCYYPTCFPFGLMSAAWAGHSIALILVVKSWWTCFMYSNWSLITGIRKTGPKQQNETPLPPHYLFDTLLQGLHSAMGFEWSQLPFVFRTVKVGFHVGFLPIGVHAFAQYPEDSLDLLWLLSSRLLAVPAVWDIIPYIQLNVSISFHIFLS